MSTRIFTLTFTALMIAAFAGSTAFAHKEILPAPDGAGKEIVMEYGMASTATHDGNLDKARKHYENAVKLDSSIAESHYNLGMTLHWLGDHKEAARHFRHAHNLARGDMRITQSDVLNFHLKKFR